MRHFHETVYVNKDVLPVSVDWRTRGAVTPVKNRGELESAYPVFAYIYALESAAFLSSGALRSLSEQQLIDCTPLRDRELTHRRLDRLIRHFSQQNPLVELESQYPYIAQIASVCRYHDGLITTVGLASTDRVTEAELELLVSQRPVVVSYELRADYLDYSAGIYRGSGEVINPHYCATVVGYDRDQRYWIIKESHGASFGLAGYVHLAYGACRIGKQGVWYPLVA